MEKRTVQNCRWAEPTLVLPMPHWFDVCGGLRICRRAVCPRLIDAAGACTTCPRWEGRAPAEAGWVLSQVGL